MLKIDELSNWEKSDLILKKGELAFATTAASTGTELSEPVTVVKMCDGEHKFSELTYNFYARSSDVLLACKTEAGLKTFINGVIADAGIASSDAMEALAGRVTNTENDLKTLKGNEETAGSIAKAIKDAIDALDLANTYVAQEDGKGLSTNDLTDELKGNYDTAYSHSQIGHAPADAQANLIEKIKVNGAEQTITDKVVDITVPTKVGDLTNDAGYLVANDIANKADKGTTLAEYGIGNAYTKTETEGKITEAINTFTSAYITSDGGAIDKLQEIANWIDSDKNGAADIIADIESNADGIETLGERMDAAEDAIEAIDNHSHGNKTELDKIADGDVAKWNAAEQNAKDYADGKVSGLADGQVKTNKEAIEAINNEETGILAQAKAYSDSLNHEDTKYTAAADGGLKLNENNEFAIDDSIVFIFDCGNSGVVSE
jgi:hypothetical protein